MSKSPKFIGLLVWSVAVFSYLLAVTNRSSLSALGVVAQEYFSLDATTLASFAVLQLGIYALMQIPVGLMIDRFGPSALILVGVFVMTIGQTLMALSTNLAFLIVARLFVGAGDASIFTSTLRMIDNWFDRKHAATLSQVTAVIGQLGQLLSVLPLAFIVAQYGWTIGFLILVAVGLVAIVLNLIFLQDNLESERNLNRIRNRGRRKSHPEDPLPLATGSIPVISAPNFKSGTRLKTILSDLVSVARIPGVSLAFWIHFTTPFSNSVFLLLWGFPFLTAGLDFDDSVAKGLLTVTIVAGLIAGLLIGPLVTKYVRQRVTFTIVIILVIMVFWTIILLYPGQPPIWLLVIFLVMVAIGGPASMISFDVVRSHAPKTKISTASGLVNVGGFASALTVILFIGLLLDFQGGSTPELYTAEMFKVAFSVQYPLWILGLIMIFYYYPKASREFKAKSEQNS